MKAFYSSFLLRIEWSRESGIIGGEIRRVYGTGRRRPERRYFRGLDLERIAGFVRENLEVPQAASGGPDDSRDTECDGPVA